MPHHIALIDFLPPPPSSLSQPMANYHISVLTETFIANEFDDDFGTKQID